MRQAPEKERTGHGELEREAVQPQASTVERLDLSEGEVGDVLPDVREHGVVLKDRLSVEALCLVDLLVVPDDQVTVLRETLEARRAWKARIGQ